MVVETKLAWKCAILLEGKKKKSELLKNKLQKRRMHKEGKHLSNMLFYRGEKFFVGEKVPWLFYVTHISCQIRKYHR